VWQSGKALYVGAKVLGVGLRLAPGKSVVSLRIVGRQESGLNTWPSDYYPALLRLYVRGASWNVLRSTHPISRAPSLPLFAWCQWVDGWSLDRRRRNLRARPRHLASHTSLRTARSPLLGLCCSISIQTPNTKTCSRGRR
jgi:hypothetical protein